MKPVSARIDTKSPDNKDCFYTELSQNNSAFLNLKFLKFIKTPSKTPAAVGGMRQQTLRRNLQTATGSVAYTIETTAEIPENLQQTNVRLMQDEKTTQQYVLKKAALWQIFIEVVAQTVTSFFMPNTPQTRPVRDAKGEYFVLSQYQQDSKELKAFDVQEITDALRTGKLHGLLKLGVVRLYLCDIDFNLGNVLKKADQVSGIDAAYCFASSFTDKKPSNPANVEFQQHLYISQRMRRLAVTIEDFKRLPRLDIQKGFEPSSWLWFLQKQKGFSVLRAKKKSQVLPVVELHHQRISFEDREKYRALLEILVTPPGLLNELMDQVLQKRFATLVEPKMAQYLAAEILAPIKLGQIKRYENFLVNARAWPGFIDYLQHEAATDFQAFIANISQFRIVGDAAVFMDHAKLKIINDTYAQLIVGLQNTATATAAAPLDLKRDESVVIVSPVAAAANPPAAAAGVIASALDQKRDDGHAMVEGGSAAPVASIPVSGKALATAAGSSVIADATANMRTASFFARCHSACCSCSSCCSSCQATVADAGNSAVKGATIMTRLG